MNFISNIWGGIPLDLSGLSKKKMAKLQNNVEFWNIFCHYMTTVVDLIDWENLPATCDKRSLNRSFLLTGKGMIAELNGSYFVLTPAPGSGVNLNGYPLKGFGYGFNGFVKEFDLYVPGADSSNVLVKSSDGSGIYKKPKAVMGYDNPMGYPYVNYIIAASKRLSDIMRACDVALQNMKQPALIVCDDRQERSVKDIMEQREDNVPAIIGTPSLNRGDFQLLNFNVPSDTLKQFWEHYLNIDADLLTKFGINSNANTDKRERLLVDEVNANNQIAHVNLMKRLRSMEQFADWVNDAFGLDIHPKINEEVLNDDADRVSIQPSTEDAFYGNED